MKINHLLGCVALFACGLGLASCASKNNEPEQAKVTEPKTFDGLLFSSAITNPDGRSGQVYLQSLAQISNKHIDNSKGIPVGFGGVTIALDNGHVYAFPDYLGNSKAEISRYSVEPNGRLKLEGKLPIPAGAAACNIVELNAEKAYLSMQVQNKIFVFNPRTMTKLSEIDLAPYNGEGTTSSPAAMLIREGLLYVGLSQFDTQWMPRKKQIEVAVIDTKTDKVQKVAKNSTLGLSSTTRPIDRYSIFTDEQGDIYFNCMGAFGFNPQYPGGIARIKHGTTEIDASYSFDLTKVPLVGSKGKHITCVYSLYYVGNGIAYGYGSDPELDPDWMNKPYSAMIGVPLEINLKTKTIKRIEGLPISGPHVFTLAQHQGKILFCSANKDANGIYSYDPKTHQVAGPLFTTAGLPNFIHSFSK